jgi:anthranilate 1,2-dioxygenase small subunit
MYSKHFITNVRIHREEGDAIHAMANGLMIQTDLEGISSLHMVGTYQDVFEISDSGFAIKDRRVIVDSFGIDNMLAVPV